MTGVRPGVCRSRRLTAVAGSSIRQANWLARWVLLCSVATGLWGCNSSNGVVRHRLQGMVTYKGKPVPKGQIIFEPDTSKGNKGPGGGCLIEAGHYDTQERMGTVGGPHRVTIYAFDGVATKINGDDYPQGTPLFPEYKTTIDMPAESSGTFDIEVPGTL